MTTGRLIEGRSLSIISCETTTTVRDAISLLAERRIGALPVMENGGVVGIFSERDVIYRLSAHGPAILDSPVAEIMASPVVSVSPDTDVLAALALMTQRRIRHLPVLDAGVMIGFVSIGDLVKYRIERIESEAEAMRSYIQAS